MASRVVYGRFNLYLMYFNKWKYLMVNVPKVSQVEHQVKFYLCFDGIKTYSLFLWSCSAIALEYECWRSSCYFVLLSLYASAHFLCEGKKNFKYPSPSKNDIRAQIFPIHTKFIRECRTVSLSFLTTGLWKFRSCILMVVLWMFVEMSFEVIFS